MDIKTIRNTLAYKEMNVDLAKEWFDYTPQKFMWCVDNLYYTIDVSGVIKSFISDLSILKRKTIESNQPQNIIDNVFMNEHSMGYSYHITKPHMFDIFINDTASCIIVQLRSEGIWLEGLENAFYDSLLTVYSILEPYDITVATITENRIDIAHHTNYIQDFQSFFKEENLAAMQVSRLKRYTKQGDLIHNSASGDYVAFGCRSSNNIFVRIYNKSKEVVQMGYKQFLVQIWYDNGLISKYDKYIFDDIFENAQRKWEYRHISRCKFFLEYGKDETIKDSIRQLLSKGTNEYLKYKKIADGCVPDITSITNVEFEVGRNFTRSIKHLDIDFPIPLEPDFIQTDPLTGETATWIPANERRIYSIIHSAHVIRKHLTTKSICFVKYSGKYKNIEKKKRPIADWWTRLISCGNAKVNATLSRDYQHKSDLIHFKIRSLNSLASFAAHTNHNDSAETDFEMFINNLNDNDLERYHRIKNKKSTHIGAIQNPIYETGHMQNAQNIPK